MESKITLADQVLAWTFGKPSETNIMLEPSNADTTVAAQMRVCRDRLKSARRFHLDVDFVKAALSISRDIDKLQYWVNLARLPYENIWIEFDAKAKVMASYEQGHFRESINDIKPTLVAPDLQDVPDVMGYLMHQTNEHTGFWVADGFAPVVNKGVLKHGKLTIIPISWCLAPEGDKTLPYRAELAPGYFSVDAKAEHKTSAAYGISAIDAKSGQLAALPWAVERVSACIEPMHAYALEAWRKRWNRKDALEVASENFAQHIRYIMKEDRGIMRFLITVLALMNNAPNIKRVPVHNPGHRYTRGRNLEYLGHSVITLELPKRKTITVLSKALDAASIEHRRNRGHEVRGHFRQVERGKGPLAYRCEHIPTLVEDGLGVCARCERLIRWIPSHARGDAELGWVSHEYNVTTRPHAGSAKGHGAQVARPSHDRAGDN